MKIFRFLFCDKRNTIRSVACTAAILVLLFATAALGDEIDDSLPPDSPQGVKTSARQAIQNGLEQDNVVELTRSMLQNKFNEQQIQQTHALMMEARNSSLPVQPLMNKAFEGMAKGVDPSLILAAMQTVQSRNEFAYELGARLSQNKAKAANLGQAIASGLAAGLSKNDADKITQLTHQRAQSMKSAKAYSLALECFNTARDVSRLGVSSQAVTNMLANGLNNGFSHQDMRAMRNAFMTQALQSEPQKLAHSYSAAIQEGKGFQGEGGGGAGNRGEGAGGSGPGSGGSAGSSGSGGSGGPGGSGGGGPGSGSGGTGGSGPGGAGNQ